jgi:hypothetical protein
MLTTSQTLRGKLTGQAVVLVANTIRQHPRFDRIYNGLDGLYGWLERAQAHYLSEIHRIGPTKARRQLGRIVNEVALIG